MNIQNKTGKRCTAAATASGRCYFHTNPKKASDWAGLEAETSALLLPRA
jgi:hypothetical protein